MEAGALCRTGADAHERRLQRAGTRDGGMLRLRGGKEKRGREAESKKDGGFNFHAAFGTTSRDDGAGAVQEKPGAAGGDKKSAPTIDSGDAKAMLYQLTTQLFSPASSKGKTDFYELLGVSRDATPKQIRDGYYRAAKKWHPDKNKHDPNAEARFKSISEAYEVLSDEEKRKIYDEHGVDGLEAADAMDKIDIKALVRALFGGGEFDDILGDVSELPMVRAFMKQGMGMQDDDEDAERAERKTERARQRELRRQQNEDFGGMDPAVGSAMSDMDPAELEALRKRQEEEEEEAAEEEEARAMEQKEKQLCGELAAKLADSLRDRALNKTSADKFSKLNREMAEELCKAPGGVDLVRLTSQTYRNKGKRYAARLFGLESYFARFKDFWSRLSQGSSLLLGFVRTSSMTQRALAKGKNEGSNSSVPDTADSHPDSSPHRPSTGKSPEAATAGEKAQQKRKKAAAKKASAEAGIADGVTGKGEGGGGEADEDSDSDQDLSLDEDDMKAIAKQGLDGLFLLPLSSLALFVLSCWRVALVVPAHGVAAYRLKMGACRSGVEAGAVSDSITLTQRVRHYDGARSVQGSINWSLASAPRAGRRVAILSHGAALACSGVARASRVAFTSKCTCSHLIVVASASRFANASKSTCYHLLVAATDGSRVMSLPYPGACIADTGLLFRYARFRSSSSQGLAEAAFPCPARTWPDLQGCVGGMCGKKPGRHGLTNQD